MGLFLKPNITQWLSEVTGQVRFRPDRAAIAEELRNHYEDHVATLLDLGYTAEEAEAKALEAMGDPREVGAALNKVHSYYLGLLWQASRALLVVLVLLLGLSLWTDFDRNGGLAYPLADRTRAELAYEPPPVWAARATGPNGTVYLAPSEEITADESDGTPVYHARLWVERRPVDLDGTSLLPSLQLETDAGPLSRTRQHNLLSPINREYGYISHVTDAGWSRQQFDVCLKLEAPPEYLLLTQPYGEEPWSIRCDWEVAE